MDAGVEKLDDSLLEDILSVNARAEELASTGEWEDLSTLLAERNAMLREIDDAKKEVAILASLKSTEQIRALVEKRKHEIGNELGQLQRGQEATKSYSANS